jgi:hypothetical protein
MDGINGKSPKISWPRPLPSTFFSLLHSTTRLFIVWTNEECSSTWVSPSNFHSTKFSNSHIYHLRLAHCALSDLNNNRLRLTPDPKNRWKDLHILFHIRLNFTMLPWKQNQLLLGRPLLVSEYRTKMNFFRPVKLVSTKSTFAAEPLMQRYVLHS